MRPDLRQDHRQDQRQPPRPDSRSRAEPPNAYGRPPAGTRGDERSWNERPSARPVDRPGRSDPYGNPRNAILDVTRNNHLWIFPTEDGFGGSETADVDISGTPMLQPTRFKISGKTALANDLFRAVHDYFGHIAEGVGFRADGEENTWRKHAAMFTPLARRALTTETRGQNSWVNFGPKAEFNRTANGADTQYAPQKVGLLPEWASEEGRGDEVQQSPARQEDAARVEMRRQLSVLESLKKCLG
jgi:hypothetical protein